MTSSSISKLLMIHFITECSRRTKSIKNVMRYARQLLMKRTNWEALRSVNALSRKIFFIIKIVYECLSRCIRLQFKKYTINLRVITLKLNAHINYSNGSIIEGAWKSRWLYTLLIITFAKGSKHREIVNIIYCNHSLFHKNVDKIFL